MLAIVLAFLIGTWPMLVSIPPEPGAQVLSSVPTYQAVAADIDGDAVRDVVVLQRGGGTAIVAAAWREDGQGAWTPIGERLEVIPNGATGEQGSVRWAGMPVRLLVREIDGRDRVTLLRQPEHLEAGLENPCCLLLHDLIVDDGVMRLVQVAPPVDSVEALHVIDLDGDGTDELVATRSLPPLGDVSYPTDAFVHRWADDAFAVTRTTLPVGSGDTPFRLGDSDGRPGDELAIVATLGRPELHRISLRPGDALGVEDAGFVPVDVMAVPFGNGRGVAAVQRDGTLDVRAWPFDERPAEPLAEAVVGDAQILGVVRADDGPQLVVRHPPPGERLHVLGLPSLLPPRFGAVTQTPAAAAFASGPILPFIGTVPGGGPDGGTSIIYAGRLLPALGDGVVPSSATPVAALAGVDPIGLVGPGRGWMGLVQSPRLPGTPDPLGGRLDPPVVATVRAITVAPLEQVLQPEEDLGVLTPTLAGARIAGESDSIAVGRAGFTAMIEAPPGSHVYIGDPDPSVIADVVIVPESGRLPVPLVAPSVPTGSARYRAALAVTTPAGHSYLATWSVRLLLEPPPLEASVSTPFGSSEVLVAGITSPLSEVVVAGQRVAVDLDGSFEARVAAPPWPTDVEVEATDPVGNVARATVSAVGWFDYRALPWIPIVMLLVAIAAVILYLRVPRTPAPQPRAADDDAAFEELEPD